MARTGGRTGIAVGIGMTLALLAPGTAAAEDGVPALAAAYNASGLGLFKQLSGKGGNIVLSPLSIGTAMAMALSGARGETETEMAKGLHLGLPRADMEAANAALLAQLRGYDKSAVAPKCPAGMKASGGRCEAALPSNGQCSYPAAREGDLCIAPGTLPASARLLIADALMLPGRGDLIDVKYASLLKDKYDAEVLHNIGLDDINNWVKRKTEGKIERILDRLDQSSPAVILNAVYFKAKWASTFEKSATREEAFNLTRARKASVPMMRRSTQFAMAARSGYRAIRLRYEVGSIGMVVLLPNEIDGLDAVARRLDAAEWAALLAELRMPAADKAVELTLPRFKAHFDADLVPPFRAEGVSRAFELKLADFSGMTGHPPSELPMAIGAIAHRAVVDVMEDGTEAAAATAITVVATAMHQQLEPPQPFHVDRPFLFAIHDEATGAILFLGGITDPR